MSRRCHTGFEDGQSPPSAAASFTEQTIWNTSTVDATAARTGDFGLHIIRTAGAGTGTGAFVTFTFNSGTDYWITAPVGGSGGPLVLTGAGNPKRIWLRVYHRPVTMNASAGNIFRLVSFLDSGGGPYASIYLSGSPAQYRLGDVGFTDQMYAPSVGTWYRLELMLEITSETANVANVNIMAWVYAENGTTPLGHYARVRQAAVPLTIDSIRLGYNVIAQNTSAQEGYFDDFAINDNLVRTGESGVHVQSPWGGGCEELYQPDAAGDSAQYTGVGDLVNTYNNVNEWPPNDDTDYNFSPAAVGTPLDAFNFGTAAAPSGLFPASAVAKSIGVLVRASDLLNGFPYYKAGIRSNGVNIDADINQTGGYFYRRIAVGESDVPLQWTNAKADAAQLAYRKTTSDATAQNKVSAIACEVEHDDALGSPPALPATQRRRGGEN